MAENPGQCSVVNITVLWGVSPMAQFMSNLVIRANTQMSQWLRRWASMHNALLWHKILAALILVCVRRRGNKYVARGMMSVSVSCRSCGPKLLTDMFITHQQSPGRSQQYSGEGLSKMSKPIFHQTAWARTDFWWTSCIEEVLAVSGPLFSPQHIAHFSHTPWCWYHGYWVSDKIEKSSGLRAGVRGTVYSRFHRWWREPKWIFCTVLLHSGGYWKSLHTFGNYWVQMVGIWSAGREEGRNGEQRMKEKGEKVERGRQHKK